MKKIRKSVFALLGVFLFSSLAGCGDTIPVLTEEENWKIAEYSAGLLLKYDVHNIRRLVGDKEIQAAYDEAYRKAEFDYKVQEYIANKKEVEASNSSSNSSSGNGSATSEPEITYTMEEILGIDSQFSLEYLGYEVSASYQEEELEELIGAMEASNGNQFVILHFALTNITDTAALCDVIHVENASYVATINGKKYPAEMTLLQSDLTQYYSELQPGETRVTSILYDVPTEESVDIESIVLKVKAGKTSSKFTLE